MSDAMQIASPRQVITGYSNPFQPDVVGRNVTPGEGMLVPGQETILLCMCPGQRRRHSQALRITAVYFELPRIISHRAQVGDHGDVGQQGILGIQGPPRLHWSWPNRWQIDILIQRHAIGPMPDVSRRYHETAHLLLEKGVELYGPGRLIVCNLLSQYSGRIDRIIKGQWRGNVG